MLGSGEIRDKFEQMADKRKQVPVTPVMEAASQESIGRLIEAIRTARPIREMQEEMYSRERGQRISAAESVKTPGLAGYYKQLGIMKGELPKTDYTGIDLTPVDTDRLIDAITNSRRITGFEKLSAKSGLMKILSGSGVPQRSELSVLSRVYGDQFGQTVMMHGGLLGKVPARAIVETANLMKTMQSSIDLSAPLRQGLPLIHRAEYWQSFANMFKYAASEDAFNSTMQAIEERPNYLLGREAGLKLTDLKDIMSREENFMSSIAEKIVPGVKISERAYVGFLNKLRADTFDSILENAKNLGKDPNEIAPDIARYVNTATGRGSLGRFEKIAPELNAALFSPRMIASRLTMLNPKYYTSLDPMVRKEAIKSLLAVAGAGLAIDGLGHLAGGTTSINPLEADFVKSRFGNTRADGWGGFQQYIVGASRFLAQTSPLVGGQRYDLPYRWGESFAANKLSPIASLGYALATADARKNGELYNRFGEKMTLGAEIEKRFIPMFIQDMKDLYDDNPNIFNGANIEEIFGKGALAAGASFGMGLNTYPEKQKNQPFRLRLQ